MMASSYVGSLPPGDMNSSIPTVPNYSYTLPFEENFDREGTEQWMYRNYHKCLYYSGAYLVSVYLGQAYMKSRKPYDLRWALVIWNFALAVMSIGGTLRSVPELFHVIRHFGFSYSLCNQSYYYDSPITACWIYIFVMSKVYELFDTLFIVLRKQKLIFLHWFHHSSVLVFTWILSNDGTAMGRWFISMNYAVHSVMYSYYALRALRIKIPRKLAMCITTSQILQMLVGFYISIRGFGKWYYQEPGCAINTRCAFFAISLYSFYFYLFVEFFVKAYFDPESVKRQLKKSDKTD